MALCRIMYGGERYFTLLVLRALYLLACFLFKKAAYYLELATTTKSIRVGHNVAIIKNG